MNLFTFSEKENCNIMNYFLQNAAASYLAFELRVNPYRPMPSVDV